MHSRPAVPTLQHALRLSSDGRQVVADVNDGRQRSVVKVYGKKRRGYRRWVRQLGYRLGLGRSSILPADRFRTECEVLRLWDQEGFEVPHILDTGQNGRLFVRMEYCQGPELQDYLLDPGIPRGDKVAALERFAATLAARHRRALRTGDRRLIHTTPCLRTVLICGPRFVFFDFETVHRPRDLAWLVQKELIGFVQSLVRVTHPWDPALVDEFLGSYPERELLRRLATTWPWGGGLPSGARESLAAWFGKTRRCHSKRRAIQLVRRQVAREEHPHPGSTRREANRGEVGAPPPPPRGSLAKAPR